MSNLILQNTPYNFFNEPWLFKTGIKEMLWEMYEEQIDDDTPIPRWDYYIEDENQFTVFYDEVISYLAFGDFHRYHDLQSEKEIDFFYETFSERGGEIDEDCIKLFDEMRLFMINTADEKVFVPIVEVW